MINFYCIDNIEFMKGKPDKYYDLAIVDPPYTDNYVEMKNLNQDMKGKKAKVGKYHYNTLTNAKPTKEYWNELKRVAKDYIVWGANYFVDNLNSTSCVIVWDKNNTGNFADCEIAFGTYDKGARIFKWTWNGMLQQNMKNKQKRIHPTEKPIELYRWILTNYADQKMKILDTHGGSMSIAIAADMEGYDLDICEIDKEYFDAGVKRYKEHKRQPTLWPKSEAGSAGEKTLKIFTDHD